MKENTKEAGTRYNSGKPRMSLVPPLALKEISKVCTYGAEKHGDWNWAKGLETMACVDSLLRHLYKWIEGKDTDEESGHMHMAHVAWNAMAIIDTLKLHPEMDNRPKIYESVNINNSTNNSSNTSNNS